MNPELIAFLKKLLEGQMGTGPGAELFPKLFEKFEEFNTLESASKANQGNVDPARDITPYRVNPFQGYLAKHGGPAKLYTPMNKNEAMEMQRLVEILPQLAFMFPGNSLLPEGAYDVEEFDRGGRIARRAARLEKRLDRLEDRGKTGSDRYENIQKRLADIAAGGSGLTGFGNTLEGGANILGKVAKTAGSLASFVPGIGTLVGPALGLAGGALDNIIKTDRELGVGLEGSQPGSPGAVNQTPGFFGMPGAGYQPSQGSLFNAINQQSAGGMGGLFQALQAFGQTGQAGSQFGLPALTQTFQGAGPDASGGIGGGLGNIQALLQQLTQGRRRGGFVFEEGGQVMGPPLIPIQTEKVGDQPEMIIHLDGTITPVNSKKRHSQMDDDEVTDIVPEGSYIASADKTIKMKKKQAEDIVLGIKAQPYKEMKQGKLPEEITFASLWGGSSEPKTPAAQAELLMKKYNIIDREEFFEHGDIFTQQTNKANLEGRIPYISEIIKFNESKRDGGMYSTATYGKGGKVTLKNVQKAPLGDWAGLIASAVPLLGNLFGGGNNTQPGQIAPWLQTGILATVPQYQLGVNENINAQSQALNQGISDFSALGNQLITNARQSTQAQNVANMGNVGLGLLNAFGKETNLPSLDLGASRSRIENFRPISASRAAVDAAATPNYDATAIMQQLGDRSGPVLAQLASQQQQGVNQAAQTRNQLLDQFNQNKIGQLNQLDQTESVFNIGQQEKERMLREDQRGQITGTFGQGLQRGADLQSGLLGQIGGIQSQILPITTQFALQNAGLAGQQNMLGSQNALNAYSMLGSMQSQNATNQALQAQNQTEATGAEGVGGVQDFMDSLKNLFGGGNKTAEAPGYTVNRSGGTTEEFSDLISQIPNLANIDWSKIRFN